MKRRANVWCVRSSIESSLDCVSLRLDFHRSIGSGLRSSPIDGKERRLTFPSQRLVTEATSVCAVEHEVVNLKLIREKKR